MGCEIRARKGLFPEGWGGGGGGPGLGLSSWGPGLLPEAWHQLLSLAFRDGLHSGWAGAQGDSASSSDETSSANGDSLFSMFSGPDLVAAVKQRRYEEIFKPKNRGCMNVIHSLVFYKAQ